VTGFGLAWRNLTGRPVRSLGTIVGVALAVASFVALIGLARGVAASLDNAWNSRGTDVVITETGAADLVSSILPETLEAEVAALPGVEAAAAELSRITSLDDGVSVVVAAWGPDAFPRQGFDLVAGRTPRRDEPRAILLGAGLAQRLPAAPGDRLVLFQAEFKVVGIVDSPSLLARNLVIGDLAEVQALTFRTGQATSINVRLSPGLDDQGRQEALDRLRAALPTYAVDGTEQLSQGHTFARISQALSVSISVVALVTAVLAVFNTMNTAVHERRAEIAILAAVGWSSRRIVGLVLVEGLMITVLAGLAGVVAGSAMAQAVARSDLVAGFIEPQIGVGMLVQALAISLAVGLAGSLVPAVRAVRMPPADILRGR